MTWTRLSDDHFRRAAVMTLSRSARLLDTELLVWCNAQTTDGNLPENVLRVLTDSPDPEADMAELLESGIWKRTKNGYKRDWSDQRTKAEVDKVREENAERQRRGRETQRQRETKHASGDHSMCRAEYCSAKARGGESSPRPRHTEAGAGNTAVKTVTKKTVTKKMPPPEVKPKAYVYSPPPPPPAPEYPPKIQRLVDEMTPEMAKRNLSELNAEAEKALTAAGLYVKFPPIEQDDQKMRRRHLILDWAKANGPMPERLADRLWLEAGEMAAFVASERVYKATHKPRIYPMP